MAAPRRYSGRSPSARLLHGPATAAGAIVRREDADIPTARPHATHAPGHAVALTGRGSHLCTYGRAAAAATRWTAVAGRMRTVTAQRSAIMVALMRPPLAHTFTQTACTWTVMAASTLPLKASTFHPVP